jgi:hypothetical protein
MNSTTYCSCSECGEIFASHHASSPSCPMCAARIGRLAPARTMLVLLGGLLVASFFTVAAVAAPIFK